MCPYCAVERGLLTPQAAEFDKLKVDRLATDDLAGTCLFGENGENNRLS